ncbi:MAG: hypothetical protein Q9227_005733 [Pyrenula ochraceoflavens]
MLPTIHCHVRNFLHKDCNIPNCFTDIDVEPSDQDRIKAERLIASELSPAHENALHSLIPPLPTSKFSSLFEQELERKAVDKPIEGGIDLSRYEAPEAPSGSESQDWKAILQRAYALSSYLSGRLTNLSLLEEHGKNSWLIGNWQLEENLRAFEKDLAQLKSSTDEVNRARKAAQQGSMGEIGALEEAWRKGIGKIIEVELATDGLRKEILERKKQGPR